MEGDDHPYKREAYERAHEIGGQRVPIARVYDCDPYTLLSRVVGDELAKEALRGSGMTGEDLLLAQENRVSGPTKRALTRREEQVVACAAMGHSNKLIAYDLGLSTGTVSVLLGRAARKLGVSGRVALVRLFREISRA